MKAGLSLISDGQDSHSWSGYEEKGVDFNTYINLKMTLNSRINPSSAGGLFGQYGMMKKCEK